MCGVVGFICDNPNQEHIDILKKFINESKIRGLHSFGYTYYDNGLITNKYFDMADIDGSEFPKPKKFIYHNRYSTSGDFRQHINNQPVTVGDKSLVFNGVVDMGTKSEIEKKYNISMHTGNDGEIILHKCVGKEDLKEFITNMKGSFAGMILNKSKQLFVVRNSRRPLWRLIVKDAVYIASTRDIFKRVNPEYEPELLEPNFVYEY
jgi:asparagine synthetase B (glutamine-hydrolysing)